MVQKIFTEQLTGSSLTLTSANGQPVALTASNTGSLVSGGVAVGSDQGPADPAVTVYSNSASFPLQGLTAGSMAFANNNNTLYLTNGSGWYKIALINQTPSITANLSSVSLGNSANTVFVGYTVAEPEGTPVTVSVSNSGISNTSQGNVVLHTSNNTIEINNFAGEGSEWTANLTLTVSDGVNLGTDTISIEVFYADPIYKLSSSSYTGGTQETPNYAWPSSAAFPGGISSDGTRNYRPTFGGGTIEQWNLSTPFDVSTLSNGGSINLGNASGIHMTTDGDYFVATNRINIYCYPTTTAHNITSPGSRTSLNVQTLVTETNAVNACGISDDGLHIWFIFQNSNQAFFADLTTAWDVSTATNVTGRVIGDPASFNILSAHIDRSGQVIHYINWNNGYSQIPVKQYVSPTAWSWSENEATVQSSATSHDFTYPSGGADTTSQYPFPIFCPENPTGINMIFTHYASTDVVSFQATLAQV